MEAYLLEGIATALGGKIPNGIDEYRHLNAVYDSLPRFYALFTCYSFNKLISMACLPTPRSKNPPHATRKRQSQSRCQSPIHAIVCLYVVQ